MAGSLSVKMLVVGSLVLVVLVSGVHRQQGWGRTGWGRRHNPGGVGAGVGGDGDQRLEAAVFSL